MLKEEWFSRYEFFVGIIISNKKYIHLKSKHKISFYPLNDQLNYNLAYHFTELKTTKGNVNKFLIDFLIVPLTKKLFYKNADEWIEKLLKIA